MGWGPNSTLWDDSVDWAYIQQSYDETLSADEEFVVTTWHDDEPLEETIDFACNALDYANKRFERLLVIDLVPVAREQEIVEMHRRAKEGH